jgi:hypothetical protein
MKRIVLGRRLSAAAFVFAMVAGAAIVPSAALATTTVQIRADLGGCISGDEPASGTFTSHGATRTAT